MARKRIPVISVVGHSNSGKTTFLERLIPALQRRGCRVATLKHDVHDFEMDREGKDSYRHKEAGAVVSMVASPRKLGLVADLDEELTVGQIVSRYVRDVDLVITEGYKREGWPKIEVFRTDQGMKPACESDPHLVAIVSDTWVEAAVPVFLRDDPEPVAEFIVAGFIRNGSV
jgi:molybdopterin-guanine dinucleotide biosynthesis protein B